MEPKSSSQFEQGGAPRETQPTQPNPELFHNTGERREQLPPRQEQSTQPQPVAVPMPVNIPLPTPVQTAPTTASQALSDDTPATAGDDDLIEKEWVDKAKKIIAATKDDPYRREREVSKLQADYLQKRYNKNIGKEE